MPSKSTPAPEDSPLKGKRQGGTLRQKLLRGGAWLGAGSMAEQALRFGRNALLTRLLIPEAFGQMAIVLAICSLFQVLTGMGIKEAVIQNPRGGEPSYINCAWWISVARGLALYLTGFLAAPWIADFYHDPAMTPLIRVAFLNLVFQSALSTRAWIAVKELQYSKWIMIQQGGSILGILLTVTLAAWLKGVWALAIGYAAEAFLRFVLSFVLCPMRPHLRLDRDASRQFLSFSKGIFGLPVLMLAYNETATFILGKLTTKEALGIYAMALTLARTPSAVGSMLVDLLMPAFSKMQDDPDRLNRGLLRFTRYVSLGALPALALAWVWGSAVLSLVYGPKYGRMGSVFALLFANEILVTANIAIASAFLALGQPALLRRFSLIRACVVVVIAYPLIRAFGPLGAATAPLVSMLTAFGVQLVAIRRLTGLQLYPYMTAWLKSAVVAGLVAAVALPLHHWTSATPPATSALVGAGYGTLVVMILALAVWKSLPVRKFLLPN